VERSIEETVMTLEGNKALVRRFYEDVINKGDMRLAEDVLAADYVEHPSLPGAGAGVAGFKQFVAMVSTAFPDLHVTVEDLIAEGDRVAARVTVSGTHRGVFLGTIQPTGKHVTWTGIDLIRIADGRIAERWNQRDLLGLMQQLGVVPSD
jgi:steroid delta-isomerase-like uncharacterized protein